MSRDRQIRMVSSNVLAERFTVADVVRWVSDGYLAAHRSDVAELSRLQLGHPAAKTRLSIMPATDVAAHRIAVHLYTTGNRGLSVLQKFTLVYRQDDGGLDTVIESDWLSWARTGATGVAASTALARPESSVLGIFGSGRQAHAQVAAHATDPRIAEVVCYSRSAEGRAAFASEMGRRYRLTACAAASPAEVLDRADIVSTATTSFTPVFDGPDVRPGTHINAIGQHYPDRRELDSVTIGRSRLFADTVERSLSEDGEVIQAIAEGAITQADVLAPLGDVIAGRAVGRTGSGDITVFTSGGLSSEYLAVASAVAAVAEAEGLGTLVDVDKNWR